MTQIIIDPGSTHDGEKKKALELIEIMAEAGADAVKFQLLTKKEEVGGNIGIDWDWLPDLIEWGRRMDIEVFASVFNKDGIKWLRHCLCKSIKFSYGMRELCADAILENTNLLNPFKDIYLSGDVMKAHPKITTNLYCIPEYPVPYIIDFENVFPLFDGFSDHTLGIKQTVTAIDMGAKYIEKHGQGPWHSNTPDGNFAIRPEEIRDLCQYANDEQVRHKFRAED